MGYDQLDSFFFPEFGDQQSLGRSQIAFGNLFGLYLVNINVYAKFYQIIRMLKSDGQFLGF